MRPTARALGARLAIALGLALGAPAAAQPADPEAQDSPPAAEDGAPAVDPWDPDALEAEYEVGLDDDPLEGANRVFFRANEVLYEGLFDPIADVYVSVVPGPVRRSVVRFFDNLGEPADCLNELLQLNPVHAGHTGARFVLNSTVGVAGVLDVAAQLGLEDRSTDFGETLGAYGVGEGWYLVLPLLGPSTLRDLVGDVVDSFFHPQVYLLAYTSQVLLATGAGFSHYEAERERLDALRDSSIDFYAALRSAYLMQRAAGVRETRAESPVLRRLWSDEEGAPAVAAPRGDAALAGRGPRVLAAPAAP